MDQGLIQGFVSRKPSWRSDAVALKALIRTARLATSFTRLTLFAEGPIAILRNALEMWSAVVLLRGMLHDQRDETPVVCLDKSPPDVN